MKFICKNDGRGPSATEDRGAAMSFVMLKCKQQDKPSE